MPKANDMNSKWQILVPMEQLQISNDDPINGEWRVGDVRFLSKEAARTFLQPPNMSKK